MGPSMGPSQQSAYGGNMLCLSQIEQQLRVSAHDQGGEGWTITLPIKIEGEKNLREHWAKKAARVKKQRQTVGQALWARELLLKRDRPKPPIVVRLTRMAARKLDDDNLARGFSAVRDEIA